METRKYPIAANGLPSCGDLHDYDSGDAIRPATPAELEASIEASKHDGGAGVILVDGIRCYVENETMTTTIQYLKKHL